MTFDEYKVSFEKKASKAGYTEENIQRCLAYAEPLIKSNLPVIYNTSHLSILVGYRKQYLKRAVVYTPYFYRDFEIKKRSGQLRTISEPLPSLKEIQHWILDNILNNVKVSSFAKAYRKKIKITDNIKFHKDQPKLFTVDLTDFFTSIKTHNIESIFRSLGYSQVVSNLLSKLCTRDGYLPQGAPTSPYLSNIFFKNADDEIINYCLEHNIRYTRYADDLSFSGDFDEKKLFDVLLRVVYRYNLNINLKKTKLMLPHQRQIVTGVVVNKKPQVNFQQRNKLRQTMYYINKFGLENHMDKLGIKKRSYLEHLLGKINFILQINPTDSEFIKYKNDLINIKREKLQ